MNNKQHEYGQHYTKETILVEKYNDILLKNINKIIVDPFCGEGHLLEHYLNLFSFDEQLILLKNKKILGLDIDEKNIFLLRKKFKDKYEIEDDLLKELFVINDSLLNNLFIKENMYIFTNPPYLAKNICKKKYPKNFDKYFKTNNLDSTDFFEIRLKLYTEIDGIWIVPSNILSSDIMNNIRKKILNKMENIIIYKIKVFEDTDISITTFDIKNNLLNNNIKKIKFVSSTKENILEFKISENFNLVDEWENIKKIKNTINLKQGYINENIIKGDNKVKLINENYKEEELFITKNDLNMLRKNILILRTTDTGGKNGQIGLYTIQELWKTDAIGLITKISSRIYTQLFFENLTIEEQLKLKNDFNLKLNDLRKKYDSIFLTNYKNVSNENQRKRITFKESYSLINYLLMNK